MIFQKSVISTSTTVSFIHIIKCHIKPNVTVRISFTLRIGIIIYPRQPPPPNLDEIFDHNKLRYLKVHLSFDREREKERDSTIKSIQLNNKSYVIQVICLFKIKTLLKL